MTPDQAAARSFPLVELRRATRDLMLPGALAVASWMSVTRDACLYLFPGVARMLIERPDRIVVEMLPGAAESDMRAYLFGIGFGTLVHMRGLVPLHVSAILTPDGVVAFTGPSGAGKSTRVAELHFRHGWPMICDDVAVLHPDDDGPLLHAGMNRIKLWKDAVERFGIEPSRLVRDLTREDKFHLLAPEMFVADAQPLARLEVLGGASGRLVEVDGGEKFSILMNAIYRPELVKLFNRRETVFKAMTAASAKVSCAAAQ